MENETHPIDLLYETIEDVQSQIKRLKVKNPHNLKDELLMNVYPVMQRGFAAILDYMVALEESDEDEISEAVEQATKEAIEEIKTISEKILSLSDEIEIKNDSAKETWEDVCEWAKSNIEKFKENNEEKETADETGND